MYISELSEEHKIELERKYQKEITDYQNKLICKQKFIYLIKKCNIMEFCYLYQTYIGGIEIVMEFLTYLEMVHGISWLQTEKLLVY